MLGRRVTLLLMLAGCGEVIGIRELGVAPQTGATTPDADSGPPAPSATAGADSGPPPETGVDAGPDAACSEPDLAGHWSGLFTASTGYLGKTGDSEADFQQRCDVISGTMSVGDCFAEPAKVFVSLVDGGIEGTVSAGGLIMTLTGTARSPNRISGNFSFSQTTVVTCYGATGTFQIERQ
jgi:hypothetical protein